MSLRLKIIRTLLVLVALYASIDHSVQRMILTPSFIDLELEHARRDLTRTIAIVDSEVAHLDRRAKTLAANPSLARMIADGDSAFRETVLHDGALDAHHLDLLFVVDASGHVLWSDVRPDQSGSKRLRGFPAGQLLPTHPVLTSQHTGGASTSGLMSSERGPLIVASQPVTSARDGSVAGRIILGAELSGDGIRRMTSTAGLEVEVWSLDDPALPEAVAAVRDEVTAAAGHVVHPLDADHLEALTSLDDIQQRPTMLLRTTLPRTISSRGQDAIQYALLSTVAIGLITLLVLQRLLGRIVLEPLAALTRHAVEIGKNDDAHARLGMDRNDELGTLGREFDSMLEKLAASREAVVTAARSAGMSEIATGILHNVGNVLNSVVLGVELAGERLRKSKLHQLEQVAALLEQHQDNIGDFVENDPRGQKLLPFLRALARELSGEQEGVANELEGVREGVDHIRELVASQQAYAGQSRLDESIDLKDQVEKAIALTAQASGVATEGIDVVREFDDIPIVSLDRHKLLEILVNLIQNARQSVVEAEVGDPRVIVSITLSEQDRILISVADNGLGISPDNLDRIFSHGFTTKKNGHGFGLHSAGNSATELGGKLNVTSEGLGHGAQFTLELPLPRAQAA